MRVEVLYFGMLKDLSGRERETVELHDGARLEDLLDQLKARVDGGRGVWESVALAVNREYARGDTELREGDEVALLPPVSGGCGRG